MSKRETQSNTMRCDQCGQAIVIVRITPFEFAYRCLPPCTYAGVISWFHGAQPPQFEPHVVEQPSLF